MWIVHYFVNIDFVKPVQKTGETWLWNSQNARDGISIILSEMSSTDLIDFGTEDQKYEEEVETQETEEVQEVV